VAQIDENELLKLEVGQRALASAEAAPDRLFGAEVSWIAPAVDPQRATVEVRLRVPEPPKFLRPDMTVSIDVQVGRKPSALVLPLEAVRDVARGPWVLLARDGRAARVPVKLGLRGDGFVEVTSGIDADAAVIPVTERAAREGSRVRIDVVEAGAALAKAGG
jgi:HlyD family secretion protein